MRADTLVVWIGTRFKDTGVGEGMNRTPKKGGRGKSREEEDCDVAESMLLIDYVYRRLTADHGMCCKKLWIMKWVWEGG